jgi:hypothetical protein
MTINEVREKYNNYILKTVVESILITKGEGNYLFDVDGK